jgi:hypothetical protein
LLGSGFCRSRRKLPNFTPTGFVPTRHQKAGKQAKARRENAREMGFHGSAKGSGFTTGGGTAIPQRPIAARTAAATGGSPKAGFATGRQSV